MKLQLSVSNHLMKWLHADFPRLPVLSGQQAGVNRLNSTAACLCWQLNIVANRDSLFKKTIVAVEANSRFTVFIPVDILLSETELLERFEAQWPFVLAETLAASGLLPGIEICQFLDELSGIQFAPQWVKNTDLSINGHITDAGFWIADTLAQQRLTALTDELAVELAMYLNTQPKRMKKRTQKVIPVVALLDYFLSLLKPPELVSKPKTMPDGANIIDLNKYRK